MNIKQYFEKRQPRMDELTKSLSRAESAALLARELRDGTIRLEDVQAGDLLAVYGIMRYDVDEFFRQIEKALCENTRSRFDRLCKIDADGDLSLDNKVLDQLRIDVGHRAMNANSYECDAEGIDAHFEPYCDVLIGGKLERIGHAGLSKYLGEMADNAVIMDDGTIGYTATGSLRADRRRDEWWNPEAAAPLLKAIEASGQLVPDYMLREMTRRGAILSPGYDHSATYPAISEWVCKKCGKRLRLPALADIGNESLRTLRENPELFRFPAQRARAILNEHSYCYCPDCAGYQPMDCVRVEPAQDQYAKKFEYWKIPEGIIAVFDHRAGREEGTNNGAYVDRWQFFSPSRGVYQFRELCSFHGDLEDYPEWITFPLSQYLQVFKEAVNYNEYLPDDLRLRDADLREMGIGSFSLIPSRQN